MCNTTGTVYWMSERSRLGGHGAAPALRGSLSLECSHLGKTLQRQKAGHQVGGAIVM